VSQPTDPLSSAYAAYEQFEAKLSTAMDQLVATNGFAELFTTSATTMMAITRIANGVMDQAVRSTRLAVRNDVVGLGRQLARTEDKLERLLQSVEAIEDRLAAIEGGGSGGSGTAAAAAPSPSAARSRSASAASADAGEPARRATVKRSAAKRSAAKRSAVAAAAERSSAPSATGRTGRSGSADGSEEGRS